MPGSDLDPGGRVPLYLQIAQLLRQEIMSGGYKIADTLPTEAALHLTYGVSRDTVRAAIGVLREEGLVTTRKGAGTSVRTIPLKMTVQVGHGDSVTARMPTPAERAALQLAEGVPVIAVKRPGAAREELFDAARAEIIIED